MKFYTNIDLKLNQLNNVVIDNVSSLVTTGAVEGQFAYLKSTPATADDGLYVFNGTAWKPVAFGTTFYPSFPPERTPAEAADFVAGDTLLRDSGTEPEKDRGMWICKIKHSVTATTTWATDRTNWELLESNTFKGAYASKTEYAQGVIVTWGGAAYVSHTTCTSPDVDITLIGPDPQYWYLLGANYRGTYKGDVWPTTEPTAETTRHFLKGDIVSYEGVTYLCKTGYTTTFTPPSSTTNPYPPTFDDTKFVALGGGDVFKNTYDTTSTYAKGDVVYHDNQLFHCKDNGTTGTWDATKWDLLLSDDWRGAFIATGGTKTADYVPGEKVSYNGELYVCITATDNAVWAPANWTAVATNIEFFNSTAARTYKAGTLVKTGSAVAVTGVYVAAEDIAVTAGATFDPAQWHSLYNDYRSTWAPTNAYKIGDEVLNGGAYYIATQDQAAGAATDKFDPDKWYKLGDAQYRGVIAEKDTTSGEIKLTAGTEYGDIFTYGSEVLEVLSPMPKGTVIGAESPATTTYRDYSKLRFLTRQNISKTLVKTAGTGSGQVIDTITIPYGCVIEEVRTDIVNTTVTPNTRVPVIVEKLYTDEDSTSTPKAGAKIQFTANLTATATADSETITCTVYYR